MNEWMNYNRRTGISAYKGKPSNGVRGVLNKTHCNTGLCFSWQKISKERQFSHLVLELRYYKIVVSLSSGSFLKAEVVETLYSATAFITVTLTKYDVELYYIMLYYNKLNFFMSFYTKM